MGHRVFYNPDKLIVSFLDDRFYKHPTRKGIYFPSVTTVLQAWPKGFGFMKWLKSVGSNAEEIVEEAGDLGTQVHDLILHNFQGVTVAWANERGEAQHPEIVWKMFCRFRDFIKHFDPEVIVIDGVPAIEVSLIDFYYKVAGTLDLVCRIDPKKTTWYRLKVKELSAELDELNNRIFTLENIEAPNGNEKRWLTSARTKRTKTRGTLEAMGLMKPVVWLLDWKSSNGIYKNHMVQVSAYSVMWNRAQRVAAAKDPDYEPIYIERCGLVHLKAMTKGPDLSGKKIQGVGWQVVEPDRSIKDMFALFKAIKKVWDVDNPNPMPKNLIYPAIFGPLGPKTFGDEPLGPSLKDEFEQQLKAV